MSSDVCVRHLLGPARRLTTAQPAGSDERPTHGEFFLRRRLLTEFRWKCGFCNGAVVARSIAVEKAEGSRRLSAEGQHRDGTELPQEKVCKSAQKTTKTTKKHGISVSTLCNLFSVMFYKIKLVNINVSDIIDGRPSIILGLIWTIILHCHVSLVDSCSHCAC